MKTTTPPQPIKFEPCGCSERFQCAGLPNRFRKLIRKNIDLRANAVSRSYSVAATKDCDDAIVAEIGVCHESAWCCTGELKIIRSDFVASPSW